MAIDRSIQTKRSGSGNTMDTLRVPDKLDMDKLSHNTYRGSKTNAVADEIFSGGRYTKQTRFGAADEKYEGAEQRRKREGTEDAENIKSRSARHKKTPTGCIRV